MALLTLPGCDMEPDAAYQNLSSILRATHSRSLGRTGARDLEIAHTCYAISRLRKFPDCADHVAVLDRNRILFRVVRFEKMAIKVLYDYPVVLLTLALSLVVVLVLC